ncbi:fibronectin type III domain-containing protein [Myxococcus llanfairpwllgwyngyllgogerychwyrndrobwllllantysiliogogogochensis]|uniref:Fibronectin type III domain-containing protein n=2 Tax=Myxococcus llanfairpwllgwyngyllgogerychwyrndrobwllllantysiliogogogochensis TaxID=2590453 RepID=A0A540X265_9BACT|nr:fibronectin type III domain-containing protein [Myxococcus llanfairpwllgwyngyllgogerychwyrndrobwllllantysiliogogogochensis]
MKMLRFSFLLGATCVAALAGCGSDSSVPGGLGEGLSSVDTDSHGSGDGTWMGEPVAEGCGPDAGVPGDGGSPDAGVDGGPSNQRAVLVKDTTRFYTSVGVAEREEDLSANPPEVLVFNGSTFTLFLGSAANGGWLFTGVPPGPFYLRTGGTYLVTSSRYVDIGRNRLGRPDAEYVDIFTSPLQANLLGLAPWQPYLGSLQQGSSLQLTSGQVDLYASPAFYEGVPDGATSIVTSQAELGSNLGNFPVFEADRGDRLYINQLSEFSAGSLPDGRPLGYSAVERAVQAGAFDHRPDGVTPIPVTGLLQPVRMREFPLEWRLPEFARLTSEVHPNALPGLPRLDIVPGPHGLADGWIGYTGELLTLSLPRGAAYDFTARLKFGNPYPSNWGLVGVVSYSFRNLEALPDGSGRLGSISGSYTAWDEFDHLIAGPVSPRVSPPRSFTIDGVPASVPRKVGTASPVLAWVPPAIGTPTAYRVAISRLDLDFGFSTTWRSFYLPGSATQLRLPPEVLEPGTTYHATVAAIDSPQVDIESYPFRTLERLPYRSASTVSSYFTTP